MTPEGGEARREVVVVPGSPGPLVWVDADRRRRGRDDLDGLIDDLFPEVEERPGWFDAGLVLVGAGLLAWAVLGDGPSFAIVLGSLALGLGCILPVRAWWRRAGRRRQQRHREARLALGVPVEVSSASTRRLVRAYESLLGMGGAADAGGPAVAAAHGALLEAASLLQGRAPASERESEYVERRAVAIEELTSALRRPVPDAGPDSTEAPALDPSALLEAREELDEMTGFNAVTRLAEITEEERRRRGPA